MDQNDIKIIFRRRLIQYFNDCPKKCFFSLYNYVVKKENSLIAFKYQTEFKFLIENYEQKVKQNNMSWAEFKEWYLSLKN